MLTPTSGTSIQDYNQAIWDGNPTHVKIEFENSGGTLTDDDINANGGISISTIANPERDLTFGCAMSSELKVSLLMTSNVMSVSWEEWCKVSFGVEINGTTDWVVVGYFKGKKPDMDVISTETQTIEFLAYDKMYYLNDIADNTLNGFFDNVPSSNWKWQYLLSYIANDVSILISVYDPGFITGFKDITLTGNPFPSGLTYRQVLSLIAEANGCYMKIGKVQYGGNFETFFTPYTIHGWGYVIPSDTIYKLNVSSTVPTKVATVIFVDTEDENNTYTYSLGEADTDTYKIVNNPILNKMTSAQKQTFAEEITYRMYERTGGLRPGESYVPMTYLNINLDCVGTWLFEAGDGFYIHYDPDNDGVPIVVPMFVFSMDISWNGSLSCLFTSTANTWREDLTESQKEEYNLNGQFVSKESAGTAFKADVYNALDQTSDGYVLDARQGKVLNDSTVHNTGNETIAGEKTFANIPSVKQNRYGAIRFKNSSDNVHTFIQTDQGTTTNQTLNQIWFGEYSPNTTADTGNTGKYERYNLPAPDIGLTANKTYDIITTKLGTFKPIYRKSVTGTTSGNGNLNLSLAHADYVVISAIANTNGACVPVRFNATNWGVHVVDAAFAPITNTSVTVTAFFVPRDGIPTL